MTLFVPLMLFSWVPLTIILFYKLKPHRAVLISVIGGILFLPQTGYDISGLPAYTKQTAIALGIILGGRLSGKRSAFVFNMSVLDLPMLIWCLCPIASSLSNGLGLYDGVSSAFEQTIYWGVPYFAGRIYFRDMESVRDICFGLVIGGLLYVPLCLYEVRMSPQLSKMLYGFFPHSWRQHFRQGGFRPIVFMQHGLMVSLWMAASSSVSFWLWKSKQLVHFKGIPALIIFVLLAVTCVLCKSVNGFFALVVGCGLFYAGGKLNSNRAKAVTLILLSIPLYLVLRTTNVVTANDIIEIAARFANKDRIASLSFRLEQESLYYQRSLDRPWFGWGGYSRGKPIDPETGEEIKMIIASLWLIAMRSRGGVGLVSLFGAMLFGPWLVLRKLRRSPAANGGNLYLIILSLIVVLFMIDSLMNGMNNSVYIVTSGALLANHIDNNSPA